LIKPGVGIDWPVYSVASQTSTGIAIHTTEFNPGMWDVHTVTVAKDRLVDTIMIDMWGRINYHHLMIMWRSISIPVSIIGTYLLLNS
jgi:hypothetical protein